MELCNGSWLCRGAGQRKRVCVCVRARRVVTSEQLAQKGRGERTVPCACVLATERCYSDRVLGIRCGTVAAEVHAEVSTDNWSVYCI